MSSKLKKIIAWSYVFLLVTAFVGAFLYRFSLGRGLSASFFQSETSIGYWEKSGYTVYVATLIAATIGDFADLNWWALVFFGIDAWEPARRVIKKLQSLTPSEDSSRATRWIKRWDVWAIPIVCALPVGGGVWTCLINGKLMKLVPIKVLGGVLIGNTIKNCSWGIFFQIINFVPPLRNHLILFTMILSLLMNLPLLIGAKQKLFRSKRLALSRAAAL